MNAIYWKVVMLLFSGAVCLAPRSATCAAAHIRTATERVCAASGSLPQASRALRNLRETLTRGKTDVAETFLNSVLYGETPMLKASGAQIISHDADTPKRNQFMLFSAIIWSMLFVLLGVLLYAFNQRVKANRTLIGFEKLRSDFLTKITHEFRTPLTVIIGFSRQLKEAQSQSDQTQRAYLSSIERQGRNLLDIVNQLLEFTQLQASPLAIEWKTGNIVAYIEMIAETFRIYAREKGVELIFYSRENDITTDFVPDCINKIVGNLLSNAIKFSKESDKIHLTVERNPKHRDRILIKVADQGPGIGKESLPHIFDLFYQAQDGTMKSGNGIGLALAKQLTEVLNGTIAAESEQGKGSVFSVDLSLQRNEKQLFAYWLPDDRELTPQTHKLHGWVEKQTQEEDPLPTPGTDTDANNGGLQSQTTLTTILLVEDNKDVALYTKSLFPENRYVVMMAKNSLEGLEIANKYIPDIVITDIIMPGKDGLELCTDIRASQLLNHIPVVILTAKSSFSDQLCGIKSGADAYICKPFQPEELLLRVEKLLETRNILKEKYMRAIIKNEKSETDNVNIYFLQRVSDIIYREIKNNDFGPTKLADELSLSVSQLNKKLNAITGFPASNYILQIKIAYAKRILTSKDISIGEAASRCGIFDVNYFARVFKKHTGVTPSQFQRMPREGG